MKVGSALSMAERRGFGKIRTGRTTLSSMSTSTVISGAGLGASHQTGWTGVIARAIDLFARLQPEDALRIYKDELLARMTRRQVAGT